MTAVLIILAIVAICAGITYWGVQAVRKAAAAATQRWADNLTLIAGVQAASHQWRGGYRGRPVLVMLSSVRSGEAGPTSYFYEVRMGAPCGQEKWSISWHRPTIFNRAPEGRVLHAKNPGLKAALEQAGALNVLANAPPHYGFEYSPKKNELKLAFTVGGYGYLPPKPEFAEQLRLLAELGDLAARTTGQSTGAWAPQAGR